MIWRKRERSEVGSPKNFRQKVIGEIKENSMDYLLGAVFVFLLGIVLYQRIILGWIDWQPWSGIGSYAVEDEKVVRGKTLWDLMELLLIPLGGAYIAFRFSKTLKKNEQKIADERKKSEQELAFDQQREAALQSYIDSMTELLLRDDGGLRASKPEDEIRVVARTRTLSTLRMLDGTRKGLLLRFIYEAGLVSKKEKVISLEDADLSNADLSHSGLEKIYLRKANLMGANLEGARLQEADLAEISLQGAFLRWTNLEGALMIGANLKSAFLEGTFLQGANLEGANLEDTNMVVTILAKANLQGANLGKANLELALLKEANLQAAHLEKANLYRARLEGADLRHTYLDDAIMPDGKKYNSEIHSIESLTA